jgi:hypothetical protein
MPVAMIGTRVHFDIGSGCPWPVIELAPARKNGARVGADWQWRTSIMPGEGWHGAC